MSKRISIKDIADAAGVNHSTVSRAIHGTGRMSEETRVRILTLADEMGYSPDALARSLVRGDTRTIGVVVTTIADPFVAQIVDGIEDVAQEAGYSVFLSSSHLHPERELAVVETFRERRVDAVIVSASRVGSLYSENLQRFGVPIVLVNNQGEGEYVYSVSADEVAGARLATEHLLSLGHRKIGFIGSWARPFSSERRKLGCLHCLEELGVKPLPDLIVAPQGESDIEVGRQGLLALLPYNPSAILAYNDMTAVGVYLQARALGLDIPSQLSLVGFDDIDVTQFISPSLTSVRQPRKAMGAAAMRMVLTLLAGNEANDRIFPCELVARESTHHL
ncbi:MAG: LacI family transcriptional regulator [Chloroflexi bacterium]|nr:LacI family transcriptional regulator [Chloroflexota bacterium]